MQKQLLSVLIGLIMKVLTPELLKDFVDMALDFVEDKVLGSKSKVDDAVVLPLCDMIRKAFNVPDNDE